ncbi:MAG: DUF4160 domain-containing protein [Chloroflexi bacterium]|nr:DUF4160 domain-containing protein [Chloroflexota bacterium]
MGELCRFYGLVIVMFTNDHGPAHFHVRYAEYEASLAVESLQVTQGQLPRRALGLAVEWASLHQDELRDNWERARSGQQLRKIEPLS